MKRLVAIALVLGAAPVARADSPTADQDRFFVDKIDDDTTQDSTLWQGSLTSTSFLHRENAGIAAPLTGGGVGTENAAPFERFFTDLRTQLDARHISGGDWDMHLDGRLRYVPQITPADKWIDYAPQSGTFGGNEYELRELYVSHGGERTDVTIGRQFVLDLAAVKIDGVRLDYASSETWTYVGFAGLYPTRGSRSIDTDYPKGVDAMGNTTSRVLPVAGGVGAAYRTLSSYGAIGLVGIVPLSNDRITGGQEPARVFATANGYWRPSTTLDVFHYVVVDLVGAAGAALTNLSIGVNWKAVDRLHVTAMVNSIDTETLNVQAQTQLSDPAPLPGVVNNEITVSRISSQSARLGLSVGLGNSERFEVSTAAQLRRRPDIVLATGDPTVSVTIKAAESAELMLQVVDRRSIAGLRLSAMVLRAFGVGDVNLLRTSSLVARVSAQHAIGDGGGEWEADLGYVTSKDDNSGVTCDPTKLATCWGSSTSSTISLDGLGMYRLGRSWLGVASLELATQHLQVTDAMTAVSQPSILMITGMVRLSYRF